MLAEPRCGKSSIFNPGQGKRGRKKERRKGDSVLPAFLLLKSQGEREDACVGGKTWDWENGASDEEENEKSGGLLPFLWRKRRSRLLHIAILFFLG